MTLMQGYKSKFESLQAKNLSDDELENKLVELAGEFVKESNRVSISNIQRAFRIGYNRAFRVVTALEEKGIVSGCGHNGTRVVL
jgi:S-DNA-T family DNA segregation ATPase FtsK/SpoIIIE